MLWASGLLNCFLYEFSWTLAEDLILLLLLFWSEHDCFEEFRVRNRDERGFRTNSLQLFLLLIMITVPREGKIMLRSLVFEFPHCACRLGHLILFHILEFLHFVYFLNLLTFI
jgi:hypothetical protein